MTLAYITAAQPSAGRDTLASAFLEARSLLRRRSARGLERRVAVDPQAYRDMVLWP